MNWREDTRWVFWVLVAVTVAILAAPRVLGTLGVIG